MATKIDWAYFQFSFSLFKRDNGTEYLNGIQSFNQETPIAQLQLFCNKTSKIRYIYFYLL